jgi:hypothetical protein
LVHCQTSRILGSADGRAFDGRVGERRDSRDYIGELGKQPCIGPEPARAAAASACTSGSGMLSAAQPEPAIAAAMQAMRVLWMK